MPAAPVPLYGPLLAAPRSPAAAGIFEWRWADFPGQDSGDHAVTLIGWGSERLKSGRQLPYWTVSGQCAELAGHHAELGDTTGGQHAVRGNNGRCWMASVHQWCSLQGLDS